MNIILITCVGAILFLIWAPIKSVYTTVSNGLSVKAMTWLSSIALINIILLIFIYWHYRQARDTPGPVGKKGYPGIAGEPAKDCLVC